MRYLFNPLLLRGGSLLLFFLFAATATQAQTNRDAQAIATIQAAILALGGQTAIGQVQTCLAQAQTTAVPGTSGMSGDFVWKNMGREFRYENGQTGDVFVSGHGKPAMVNGGSVQNLRAYVGQANFSPDVIAVTLLAEFQNANYSLTYVGTGTAGGNPALVVQTSLTSDTLSSLVTPQSWYFDANTGLPLRVEYQLPDLKDPNLSLAGAVELSNYQAVSGVMVPLQISYYVDGQATQSTTLSSVAFNSGVTLADFDVPQGGAQ